MTVDEKTFNKIVNNASAHFKSPKDVLHDPGLDKVQKRKILESWKVDEIELSTATEENMGNSDQNRLSQVIDALEKLGD